MSHYRYTQHARHTMAGEPYLLQPVPFARVNTALAIQGRTALSTHHMDSMRSSNSRNSAPQQPCGPGAVCRRSADCPDHYCEGHPGNTHESSDPTDFAGLTSEAQSASRHHPRPIGLVRDWLASIIIRAGWRIMG